MIFCRRIFIPGEKAAAPPRGPGRRVPLRPWRGLRRWGVPGGFGLGVPGAFDVGGARFYVAGFVRTFKYVFLEVLQGGQVAEIPQPEILQKLTGGAVHNGPSGYLFSPRRANNLFFEEGFDDAAGIHSSDVFHLLPGEGLFVGDDGQGIEARLGQLGGFIQLEILPHPFGVFLPGPQLKPARHFLDLQVAGPVFLGKLVEHGADRGLFGAVLQRAGHIFNGHGLIGGEEDIFDDGFEFGCFHRSVLRHVTVYFIRNRNPLQS
jgi:hypothetical protein